MVVGKPDFDLNSFGIQYREKKVNYTNKRMGAFSQGVTTETEDASERALWSKMDKPQSAKDRANKIPANAVQSAGQAPFESPKPKRSKTRQNRYSPPGEHSDEVMRVIGTRDREGNAVGNPGDKEEIPKTSTRHEMDTDVVPGMNYLHSKEVPIHSGRGSSPDVTTPEDTSGSVRREGEGDDSKIIDLKGSKGTRHSQTQGKGLTELVGQEGGSTHRGYKPKTPGFSPKGSAALIAAAQLKESKKNPTLPVKEGKKLQDKKTRQAVKSNQIILKMNLMKLDLMKRDGEKIGANEKDTRQAQDRFNEDHLSDFPEIKGTKEGNKVERHLNEHMAPVGKSASETIFKAISLKLDLMEVTKHKELGAKRVTPEEMPQKEAHHTFQGGRDASGQHTVKHKPVGSSVRRVNPKTGITEKVPNEIEIPGLGNEKESTKGKIINTKDTPTPQTVANAQQLITDNPTTSTGEGTIDPAIASGTSGEVSTWNDGLPATGSSALGGDQTETAAVEADKEDLEDKFINTEASAFMNSEVGKKIAAKRAKREALKRKRGERVNRSISEINDMTNDMKELLKDGSPVPSAPYGTTIQRLRDGDGANTRTMAARASAEDAYKKDHPEEDEDDFVRN